MVKDRLTFGFRNTEILFLVFMCLVFIGFQFLIYCTAPFDKWLFVLFMHILGGTAFSALMKDELLEEKGYGGAFLTAVAIAFPLSYIFSKISFKKLASKINKL